VAKPGIRGMTGKPDATVPYTLGMIRGLPATFLMFALTVSAQSL
jgi:hypothetical protein